MERKLSLQLVGHFRVLIYHTQYEINGIDTYNIFSYPFCKTTLSLNIFFMFVYILIECKKQFSSYWFRVNFDIINQGLNNIINF